MTSIRLPYIQEYRDRAGKVRRYFRRPGFKRVCLPGVPGSPQFMSAYEAALANGSAPVGRSHREGTIAALVVSFYKSQFFDNLKPQSRRVYRLILDNFSREDGHRLVSDMPRRVAMSMIEEIGETRPGMANLTTKVMRRLFAYAIKKELRQDNPFVGIESYKMGTHHTWTDAEISAYEAAWPIGTRERLAFDLLLYTGQRVGDVAAMRRVDIRNGSIHLTQEKTGVDLSIPLHSNLVRSMKACPASLCWQFRTSGIALSSVTQSQLQWYLEAFAMVGLAQALGLLLLTYAKV
jgi:hypothetical protein